MSRLSSCLLLTCFAFAVLCGRSSLFAATSDPSALALLGDKQDREIDKYNRKISQLEIKRTRDRQKLEAGYLKLLQRKKTMDLRKLQQRLDEIQRKQERLDRKYRLELEKIERERERKGL